MDLRETYNRIASDWCNDHKSDDWWIKGTDTFIASLEKGASVLDVGCGPGIRAKYLRDKSLNVTGIDFSEKFIEIAKREVKGAEFIVMDMEDCTALNKTFDSVFAQASLLHIAKKDISNVLAQLVGLLKPRGYFYVAVKGMRPDGKQEGIVEENDYGYTYQRFFSYYSLEELRKYFAAAGLVITYESENMVGKTNWIQVIGRKA